LRQKNRPWKSFPDYPGNKTSFRQFLDFLKKTSKEILIQTHDYPDPDAVASAFGMFFLLSKLKIPASIVYCGVIQRAALKTMIDQFEIPIKVVSPQSISSDSLIIIVDGCKGNKNVTDLPGKEIAVIDHHNVNNPESVFYMDIRSHIGSCSTIITQYFELADIKMTEIVATILMVGLNRDTDMMMRDVSDDDLEAYYMLSSLANRDSVSRILRNNLNLSDLSYYQYSLDNLEVKGKAGFIYYPEGCPQNLLGILGDFILSLDEIELTVLLSQTPKGIHCSIRNEMEYKDAYACLRTLLLNKNDGGGHASMAAGLLTNKKAEDIDDLKNQIENYLLN